MTRFTTGCWALGALTPVEPGSIRRVLAQE
jgi:hypothetical protein